MIKDSGTCMEWGERSNLKKNFLQNNDTRG